MATASPSPDDENADSGPPVPRFPLPADRHVTVVPETKIIYGREGQFGSQIPPGLRVYLDPKKKIMVRFLSSGLVVPFEHPLVTDYLYATLAAGKKGTPDKGDLEQYLRRARLSALGNVEHAPDTPEWWEAQLWNEPVVMAALHEMEKWYAATEGKEGTSRTFSLTLWREKLVDAAKDIGVDHSEWPRANWFRGFLEDRQELLNHFNLRLGVGDRVGTIRRVTISFIDETKIPGWNGHAVKRK